MNEDDFLYVIIFIVISILVFVAYKLYDSDENVELETIKKVQEVYKYDHCKLYDGKYYCYNDIKD